MIKLAGDGVTTSDDGIVMAFIAEDTSIDVTMTKQQAIELGQKLMLIAKSA